MDPALGQHRTTGLDVQVARTLDGRLAWVSDPLPGNWHDTRCLAESGVLDRDVSQWIGDNAHVGMGILTPIRTPARRELVRWERNLKYEHNSIASVSNTPSPTSRPGAYSTPTTGDHSPPSPQPSSPSSAHSSTAMPE
ncbi:transposase family protein [Actinokineospora cianjurensis]|uniref:transposase family protein n=1 Tax=Actinokineospora cianjurensis TaxID=585224 RepID=UPI001476F70A